MGMSLLCRLIEEIFFFWGNIGEEIGSPSGSIESLKLSYETSNSFERSKQIRQKMKKISACTG